MKVVQLAEGTVIPDLLLSSNAFLHGTPTQSGEMEQRDGLALPVGEPVCQGGGRWRRLVKQMFGSDGLCGSAGRIWLNKRRTGVKKRGSSM